MGHGGDEAGLTAQVGGDEDVLGGDALVRTMAPPQLYTRHRRHSEGVKE